MHLQGISSSFSSFKVFPITAQIAAKKNPQNCPDDGIGDGSSAVNRHVLHRHCGGAAVIYELQTCGVVVVANITTTAKLGQ